MYIALYNAGLIHLGNISHVTYDLTQRIFENDTFTASGLLAEAGLAFEAVILALNEDNGASKYACFVAQITIQDKLATVKGLDFKSILSSDVLLDYTNRPFSGNLLSIYIHVQELLLESPDVHFNALSILFEIDENIGSIDVTEMFGTLESRCIATNAYTFLDSYNRFYGVTTKTRYDEEAGDIIFTFTLSSPTAVVDIRVEDFIHKASTPEPGVNKAIATLKWEPEATEPIPFEPTWHAVEESTLRAGRPTRVTGSLLVYEVIRYPDGSEARTLMDTMELNASELPTIRLSLIAGATFSLKLAHDTIVVSFSSGNPSLIGSTVFELVEQFYAEVPEGPGPVPPRPVDLATCYYYLTADDQLMQSDEAGSGVHPRALPARQKIFESEFLAEAQFDAVYELATSRYADNVEIECHPTRDPIDLSAYNLYDKISVYGLRATAKVLPISEIRSALTAKGLQTTIKLGMKKTLLTEIIKDNAVSKRIRRI